MIDLYADYERRDWRPGFHHSMNMLKLFVGYTSAPISIGAEGFLNHGKQDVVGIAGNGRDTLDANALGFSVFARGKIISDKLGFFARMDLFNPDQHYDQGYQSYEGLSSHFDPNTREEFFTAGLDFTPVRNVHLMPNVWYNGYHGRLNQLSSAAKYDYDLVYRMTFYYVFGK
jgi:hypothetical protein